MKRATVGALVGVVTLGVCLRLWVYPPASTFRDVDERGYLQGGLAVLEGLPPGYQASPAGPLTWSAWAYAAGSSFHHLLRPGPEEQAVPMTVRPYFAVNHALFDAYRDMAGLRRFFLVLSLTTGAAGIAAAFGLGQRYGGVTGGLLVGGLAAFVPLFVGATLEARPYSGAWSLAFISLYFAGASPRRHAWIWAGIFFGLCVASRIDMLVLLPLALWLLWDARGTQRPARLAPFALLGLAVACLAAPWWMTGLLGNLRAIATIQLIGAPSGTDSPLRTIQVIGWAQGLGPVLILLAAAPFLPAGGERSGRWGKWVLVIYLLLLAASGFKSTGFGIHHKGAVAVGLIAVSGLAMARACRPRPELAWPLLGVMLLLPAIQTVRECLRLRSHDVVDGSTAWVERHVRPGGVVYLCGATLGVANPLPTPERASAIWREVSDEAAGEKKFSSGLGRVGATRPIEPPRAMDELNLVQERGNHRGWYILGSRAALPVPRFDIRLVRNSPIAGVQDLQAAVAGEPGVVVWREAGIQPPAWLGEAVAQWTDASHTYGVWIFCPPEARGELIDPP